MVSNPHHQRTSSSNKNNRNPASPTQHIQHLSSITVIIVLLCSQIQDSCIYGLFLGRKWSRMALCLYLNLNVTLVPYLSSIPSLFNRFVNGREGGRRVGHQWAHQRLVSKPFFLPIVFCWVLGMNTTHASLCAFY